MREDLSHRGGGRRYACQVLRDAWRPPVTSYLRLIWNPVLISTACETTYSIPGVRNGGSQLSRALDNLDKRRWCHLAERSVYARWGSDITKHRSVRLTAGTCLVPILQLPFRKSLRQVGTCIHSRAPMPKVKRIAIIGAGPAGAISIDAFAQEQAFDVIRVFERRERPGGCW